MYIQYFIYFNCHISKLKQACNEWGIKKKSYLSNETFYERQVKLKMFLVCQISHNSSSTKENV